MAQLPLADKVDVGGIYFDNLSFEEALLRIEGFIAARTCCYVTTPNIDHIVRANKSQTFARYNRAAAMAVPDGMPVVWASRLLGRGLKARITGADLLPALCRLSHEKGYKLFFLGGRPGAAVMAKEKIECVFPHVRVTGIYCPPYGFENDMAEDEKIRKAIFQASPDILLVGLGSPKQELWIEKNYQALGVPVSIGVGASFEFLAGIVSRAPRWMQTTGLEWLWRLFMEPRRLWKRYLIDDIPFFAIIAKQLVTRKKQ